jgi:hypothetical protein
MITSDKFLDESVSSVWEKTKLQASKKQDSSIFFFIRVEPDGEIKVERFLLSSFHA